MSSCLFFLKPVDYNCTLEKSTADTVTFGNTSTTWQSNALPSKMDKHGENLGGKYAK